MMNRATPVWGLWLVTLVIACGGGPTDLCTVTGVSVAPAQVSLMVTQSATLNATVNSTNCSTPPGVTWSSGSLAVGLQPNGSSAQVTGMSVTAIQVPVTATADGHSGSALVSVTAPLPTTIVFTSGTLGNRQIWRMDPTGANRILLSQGGFDEYVPALSPNGTRIAFVRNGVLYAMNADGSGATPLISAFAPADEITLPAWSPDGLMIAYTEVTNCGFLCFSGDIKVSSSTGQPLVTLASTAQDESYAAWSPNGATVVFAADASATNSFDDIFRVPATGGATVPLFVSPSLSEKEPEYSPDGSQILFREGSQLFVVSSTGAGAPIPLTTTGSNFAATWSPDGTRIAYESVAVGETLGDIWVMNADGSNKTNITNTPAISEFQPSWGIKVGSQALVTKTGVAAPRMPAMPQMGSDDPRTGQLESMLKSPRFVP